MARDSDADSRSTERAQPNDSRRRFLRGSAGTLGGLAIGTAFASQSAFAGDDDDEETSAEEPASQTYEDDLAILNYALTLERLQAAFYREALENMRQGMMRSGRAEEVLEVVAQPLITKFRTIQEQEEAHVEFFSNVIESIDGEPAEEPEFDFGSAVEDPGEFLATAVVLEDAGVAAYAGAAPHIENEQLLGPALGIHSVEARHASFVRTLAGEIGFPDAFDEPLAREQVLALAGQFIVDETANDEAEDDDGGQVDDGEQSEDDEDDETTESDDY